MIYYAVAATICFFVIGGLYYIKCREHKTCNRNLDLMIGKYVGLMEQLDKTQKDYRYLSDKYRYKLSLVAVLQDKLAEASAIAEKLQSMYNLLYQAYNENKDDLRFAEAILAGTPEQI